MAGGAEDVGIRDGQIQDSRVIVLPGIKKEGALVMFSFHTL